MNKNILFIHAEKKFKTGAQYVNETIINNLELNGYTIDMLYPKESIDLLSQELAGIANILFFHSLVKEQDNGSKYSLIQGTTYTTLAFLGFDTPVISHFGSTTWGFLDAVPTAEELGKENPELVAILQEMYDDKVISKSTNSLKPLEDISGIEIYVAKKSDAVIATSEKVRAELIENKIPEENIYLIHNAIENYWFGQGEERQVKPEASLVYLGRVGNDDFTIKLKGLLHLICVFRKYPARNKVVIGMCHNTQAYEKFFKKMDNTKVLLSVAKEKIPEVLREHYGDIYINTSQYEGFCLSLVEAMSQGLIPVVFAFWVAPEIIRNGENGYVVNTLEEMAERIDEIASDLLKRERMAENAIATAEQFHPSRIIGQYMGMYASVIEKDVARKVLAKENLALWDKVTFTISKSASERSTKSLRLR